MDYLVTAKGLIDIVNDSTAMSLIGLNNYASNTLLADSIWLNAICNSTYFESVLNDKVPTMTDATAPSGEVSASSSLAGYPEYVAYKAFDGNDNSYWQSGANTGNNSWIQYKFDNPNKIKCLGIKTINAYNTYIGTLQASSDGNTFTDMKSNISVAPSNTAIKVPVKNLSNLINMYYRMQTVQYNYADGSGRTILSTVQFYCRKDV